MLVAFILVMFLTILYRKNDISKDLPLLDMV